MPAPATARVKLLGLTGGLGAGKSTALAACAELGAATLSTDVVVHELLGDGDIRGRLVERFGPDVVVDSTVDRSALAQRAFASADERAWLEGLLWPRVSARVQAWRTRLEEDGTRATVAVVEVPLLFEAAMEGAFDRTVAVVADESVRVARADRRGHAVVDERAARQLSQGEKSQLADITVRNDGDFDELKAELSRVLARIRDED